MYVLDVPELVARKNNVSLLCTIIMDGNDVGYMGQLHRYGYTMEANICSCKVSETSSYKLASLMA